MLSVFALRVVGFAIIVAILGIAWMLWVNASRLEEEIEVERIRPNEE